MLHTHLADDEAEAKATTRTPFREYLRSAVSLETKAAKGGGTISGGHRMPAEDLPDDVVEDLLDLTCDRYLRDGSLIGSPESCRTVVERFAAAGVDEVACLVDFGLSAERILAGLPPLITLARHFSRTRP